jgi:biotin carboxyl carrier protein
VSWLILEDGGRRRRVAAARTRDGVWIAADGRSHFFPDPRRRRTAATGSATAADALRAPMTGKVVAVNVAPGDQVASGVVLVVLEAMKMEYRLTAPHAGRVIAVTCTPGELVDLGAALVTLGDAPAGTEAGAGAASAPPAAPPPAAAPPPGTGSAPSAGP